MKKKTFTKNTRKLYCQPFMNTLTTEDLYVFSVPAHQNNNSRPTHPYTNFECLKLESKTFGQVVSDTA